jgi:hypothetical protein
MIKIIHKLRMARGTNAKLRILQDEDSNEDWKKVLLAMYNTSINYYTGVPNDNTFISTPVNMDGLMDHLDWLSTRSVTGNDARAHAKEGSQVYGEIFRLILGGSLKCGISTKTINKAYPGLIPTFDVMLANDVDTEVPCYASTKYDGVRLLAFIHPSHLPVFKTRAGKTIEITSLLRTMAPQLAGVYDGELVSGDGLQEGRTKITGAVNKCLLGNKTDIDQGYTFCIFDHLTIPEWITKGSRPFSDRYKLLKKSFIPDNNAIVAPQYKMESLEQINMLYADRINKGYEGIIARYGKDPYVWGRSNKLIKKKATEECILECVGTTEGTGKYEGMIGALICQGLVKGKLVQAKLGSGLTDHDREQASAHYIDKDIDVLYNDITIAEGAKYYSLFLPRFKRIRGDHNV